MDRSELKNAFTSAVRQMMLGNRTESVTADATPAAGANYDMFLLRGERVVSVMRRSDASSDVNALDDVVGGDAGIRLRVCQYLNAPRGDFYAVALNGRDRVMLVSSVAGLSDGEGIAVVPHIGAHSMARTLCYSFAGRVELDASVTALGGARVRESDEATYLFIERLFLRWRLLVSGRLAWSQGVPIDDRRTLSRQMVATGRAVFAFLGLDEAQMTVDTFPVPYPFNGTYYPARAAWLMLCLYGGLCRSFSRAMGTLRVVMDNERLLPMIELTAGHRTPMPSEWDECSRVAERYGMLFEANRAKNTVRVCLCPMTPNTSPAAFYALRAPVSVLWQLRSSVAGCVQDMQQE